MPDKEQSPSTRLLYILVFGLPLLFWIYLVCTCQTEIKWDSLDYEHLGQMIYHQGWVEYFKTGPNREPLYPFMISLAMRLGDLLHYHYLKVLVIFQFALLFTTQFCSFKILQKLNINPIITAMAVFYIGVSPGLINCALSLYSEILIIALMQAAILLLSKLFNHLPKVHLALASLSTAVILLSLALVKGIFELTGPLILLSFMLITQRVERKPGIFKRFLFVIFLSLGIFSASVFVYKSTNKHFNGNFTLTNRGAWAFYGFAARRAEPMSKERLMAGLAFVPGEGVCKKFYTEDACYFWSFYMSDTFSTIKLKELMAQGYQGDALDKKLLSHSAEKIKTAPVQYTMLTIMESFKVFFWETTKLGFVIYPQWLGKLHDVSIFKDLLRLVWAILSLAGVIKGIIWLTRKRCRIPDEPFVFLFIIMSFLFFYTAIYSLFQLGPRYAIPMGPSFVILTAILLQCIINCKTPAPKSTTS